MKEFDRVPIHLIAKDGKYLCNKAVTPTPEKSTENPSIMTCENCKRIYDKYWMSPESREAIEKKRGWKHE